MNSAAEELARVQLLLSGLFLSGEVAKQGLLRRAPLEWISEWLRLDPQDHFGEDALLHLVAVQLAPSQAILYSRDNPKPRWRLIEEHLNERFSLSESDRARVARSVAVVLDHASEPRGARLIASDTAESCAICHLPFREVPTSVISRDQYKPVWQASEELCKAEVDHIRPISGLGGHLVENLQVTCRACNLAKGSGLVIDPDVEVRFAGRAVGEVPRVHLFRLLQWLILSQGGTCSTCGATESELTMRPTHPEASLTRTNLALFCYGCT